MRNVQYTFWKGQCNSKGFPWLEGDGIMGYHRTLENNTPPPFGGLGNVPKRRGNIVGVEGTLATPLAGSSSGGGGVPRPRVAAVTPALANPSPVTRSPVTRCTKDLCGEGKYRKGRKAGKRLRVRGPPRKEKWEKTHLGVILGVEGSSETGTFPQTFPQIGKRNITQSSEPPPTPTFCAEPKKKQKPCGLRNKQNLTNKPD